MPTIGRALNCLFEEGKRVVVKSYGCFQSGRVCVLGTSRCVMVPSLRWSTQLIMLRRGSALLYVDDETQFYRLLTPVPSISCLRVLSKICKAPLKLSFSSGAHLPNSSARTVKGLGSKSAPAYAGLLNHLPYMHATKALWATTCLADTLMQKEQAGSWPEHLKVTHK